MARLIITDADEDDVSFLLSHGWIYFFHKNFYYTQSLRLFDQIMLAN